MSTERHLADPAKTARNHGLARNRGRPDRGRATRIGNQVAGRRLLSSRAVRRHEVRLDQSEDSFVRVLIRRDHQLAIGVERAAVKTADLAARRLAQRDARGEVKVLPRLAVRDVGGSSSRSHPRHGQGG